AAAARGRARRALALLRRPDAPRGFSVSGRVAARAPGRLARAPRRRLLARSGGEDLRAAAARRARARALRLARARRARLRLRRRRRNGAGGARRASPRRRAGGPANPRGRGGIPVRAEAREALPARRLLRERAGREPE